MSSGESIVRAEELQRRPPFSLPDWLIYRLARIFLGSLDRLPRSQVYSLCEQIGLLVCRLDRKHRKIAERNLSLAFPHQSFQWKMKVLKASFRQLGRQAVELARLAREDAAELRKRVQYEEGFGLEHYRSARRNGPAVLFLTAHISAWEVLPAAHALHCRPLSFLVRPLNNPYLDRWATGLRKRFGNTVLSKQQSLRRVYRRIQSGEDVGFLIDQNVQEKDGIFAPFFNHPACTTAAPAALSLRTSAWVVPGFIFPQPHPGQYRIRFYPPLEPVRSGNFEKDLVAATTAYNRVIEEVIREIPHCWLWGHRRFHTQPGGVDFYAGLES